jgi:hypothetical protein
LAISGVADRMPQRLRRLVFLDATLPESGKSIFEQMAPEVREARIKAAQAFSGGVSMPPPRAETFGVTDPADTAWVERRLTPHPIATYSLPLMLKHPLGNGLPVTYIRCIDPAYANTAASAEFARSHPGWQYLEIRTGHDAMVTAPAELTEMLLTEG